MAVVTWVKTLSPSSVFSISRMLEGTYPAWPLRFRSFHHCLPSSSTWQTSVTGQLRLGRSNILESERSCGYASAQGFFFGVLFWGFFYLKDFILQHRQLVGIPGYKVVENFGIFPWVVHSIIGPVGTGGIVFICLCTQSDRKVWKELVYLPV